MEISVERPNAADVVELLAHHVEEARSITPPEFSFALPGNALMAEDITFWTARKNGMLLGFAALKDLGDGTGEVKSMRTSPAYVRKGVAANLLDVIIRSAQKRKYRALYLETGVTEEYLAARRLYEVHGFSACDPFADYIASGHNYFMRLDLLA